MALMARAATTQGFVLLFLPHFAGAVTQARLKFRYWFPYYESHFVDLVSTCAQQLNDYWENNRERCWSNCACAVDCLLANTTDTIKYNMQSATIVLGLMPTIIALLAPNIAEMAVLSTYSPVLAVLLCFGCPAVRIDGMPSVHWVMKRRQSKMLVALQGVLGMGSKWRFAVRAVLYLFGLAAVANVVELSVRVDLRTVSGWRCGQMFMPLIWSELSIAAYGLGMLAVRTRVKPSRSAETQKLWHALPQSQDTWNTELLWCLALFAVVGQSAFGILVFASLVFVSVLDAVPVLLRYAASCVVARLIVTFELASLREVLSKIGHLDDLDDGVDLLRILPAD